MREESLRVNLCSGPVRIDGFINIDLAPNADIRLDLEKELIPLADDSVNVLVCISAINYFTLDRGGEIIKDVYRVMKPGGVVRFATQDLRLLVKYYLDRNELFFNQKLADGQERFKGITLADKLSKWFYGFSSYGKKCRYVYDFETLSYLFQMAGFVDIREKNFTESDILEIKKIDNRKDQMFFLECRKESSKAEIEHEPLPEYVQNLWQRGQREKAWQILLECINGDDVSDHFVMVASDIALALGNHEDVISFAKVKIKKKIGQKAWREALGKAMIVSKKVDKVESKELQSSLAKYGKLPAVVLPDQDHLDLAMAWLLQAFKGTGFNGVSSAYDLQNDSWGVGYPETTGYIIATCLQYASVCDSSGYRVLAERMGEWELSLQQNSGGFGEPLGKFAEYPRIFNSSQIMFGLMALYRCSQDERYLESSVRAADWIVNSQDSDGKWRKNTYAGPRSYHVRAAWALMELYKITGNERYCETAGKNLRWTLSLAEPNGFFRETSLSDPERPWTHLIGYTLVGLVKMCAFTEHDSEIKKTLPVLEAAALNLMEVWNNRPDGLGFVGFHATYDCFWQSTDCWSCVTGNAQLSYFLRKLALYSDIPGLNETADDILKELKWAHFVGDDFSLEVQGGLPASIPVNGPYGTMKIFNWSVKFFADALLEKIYPNSESDFIG